MTGLDEQIVTGEALHATRERVRVIVEKGGEYRLQIKDNQPTLAALAERAYPALPQFFC